MGFVDDRDALVFDIAYAIWRAPIRGVRRNLLPEDRQRLAGHIADHLKLANWIIRKGEPLPLRPAHQYPGRNEPQK